jgi:hypothetical protein
LIKIRRAAQLGVDDTRVNFDGGIR